jgi:hypothetical protein
MAAGFGAFFREFFVSLHPLQSLSVQTHHPSSGIIIIYTPTPVSIYTHPWFNTGVLSISNPFLLF